MCTDKELSVKHGLCWLKEQETAREASGWVYSSIHALSHGGGRGNVTCNPECRALLGLLLTLKGGGVSNVTLS